MKITQNNSDITAKKYQAVMKYSFLKGILVKENYDMSVKFGDKCPCYFMVKNWVARLRTRYLSNEDK
jgi:hypothetical protein